MGVKTIKLTEARGKLAGARVVRDGYQVMLISNGGTVIKMPVEDVKRLGRSTQGVIVMRLRDGEMVSTLAPVIDDDDEPDRRSTTSADAPVEAGIEPPPRRSSTRTASSRPTDDDCRRPDDRSRRPHVRSFTFRAGRTLYVSS